MRRVLGLNGYIKPTDYQKKNSGGVIIVVPSSSFFPWVVFPCRSGNSLSHTAKRQRAPTGHYIRPNYPVFAMIPVHLADEWKRE